MDKSEDSEIIQTGLGLFETRDEQIGFEAHAGSSPADRCGGCLHRLRSNQRDPFS